MTDVKSWNNAGQKPPKNKSGQKQNKPKYIIKIKIYK